VDTGTYKAGLRLQDGPLLKVKMMLYASYTVLHRSPGFSAFVKFAESVNLKDTSILLRNLSAVIFIQFFSGARV
jgi:hypothetical protein